MKTAEEMKEFKGTKGEWTINHWKREGGSGATYNGESNGITHYTGDNVGREVYNIVSDIHPNSHNVEHSFEGAHIAEIAARSEESLANAQLIAAAPDLLEALLSLMDGIANLPPLVAIDGVLKTEWEQGLKAIVKALGL